MTPILLWIMAAIGIAAAAAGITLLARARPRSYGPRIAGTMLAAFGAILATFSGAYALATR